MTLIALGDDEVINLESIASAVLEDAKTRTGKRVKLVITFAAGQSVTFSGDDAIALWKALRDSATTPSLTPCDTQLTALDVSHAN